MKIVMDNKTLFIDWKYAYNRCEVVGMTKDNQKVFKKTNTFCTIKIVFDDTSIKEICNTGIAVLGRKETFNKEKGRKVSLKRALAFEGNENFFNKKQRKCIWESFLNRSPKVTLSGIVETIKRFDFVVGIDDKKLVDTVVFKQLEELSKKCNIKI